MRGILAAVDGSDLEQAAERVLPHVMVPDIAMPGIDGIEAAVLIRRRQYVSRELRGHEGP